MIPEIKGIFEYKANEASAGLGNNSGRMRPDDLQFLNRLETAIGTNYGAIVKDSRTSLNFHQMNIGKRLVQAELGAYEHTWVLHHMDDELIRNCARELQRVIRKRGALLVAEPVYTKGKWLSTFCLDLDRGKYIRTAQGYRALFDGFRLERESFFNFSYHRFCSFVFRGM